MGIKVERGLGLKILRMMAIGAAFTAISIIAPQFPYLALKAILKKKFGKTYHSGRLVNSINYLKRKKFVAYTNGKYIVTKIGRERLAEAELKELKIIKHPWDQKWRWVSFDIPEELKAARQLLSRKLKQMGFYNFQRSLFVTPYRCEKEINLLSRMLKITPHIHLFVADRFPNDQKLLKSFFLN